MKKSTVYSFAAFAYLFLASPFAFASDLYDQAVAAFRANQPDKAQSLIEQTLKEEGDDASLYNYLGCAYYQTGDYEKSYDAFVKGASVPFADKGLLYFNAGNAAFALGDFARAESSYTRALDDDETMSGAILNRANSRIKLGKNDLALSDYEQYLALEAESPQKDAVASAIAYIKSGAPISAAESTSDFAANAEEAPAEGDGAEAPSAEASAEGGAQSGADDADGGATAETAAQ